MADKKSRYERARSFSRKPLSEQAHIARELGGRNVRHALKRSIDRVLPFASLPRRIEGGAWWLSANDYVGDAIYEGSFERRERAFVERFLQPGMVMVDVGAHHGLYSVIAATRVGPSGVVVSFEPSERERKRLAFHRRINRLSQIKIEPLAIGKEPGEATLYIPSLKNSGFNSLRPSEEMRSAAVPVVVEVTTIDDYLARSPIGRVDLVKLDIEGGELNALKGATETLAAYKPVILCEVEDERTLPWGYRAEEIIDLLQGKGYRWFVPQPGGRLLPSTARGSEPGTNLVAITADRDAAELMARSK